MKILSVGSRFFVPSLRQAGHRVVSLGVAGNHHDDHIVDFFASPPDGRTRVAEAANHLRPDWILQVDDSTPLAHLGLEDLDLPKAWFSVDTHLHGEWHKHYATLFDIVFCAQQNRAGTLSRYQERMRWLPLFFGGEPAFDPWRARAHDAAFVGTLNPALNPARSALFESLRRRGVTVELRQGAYAPVYRAARVVVNQSVNDDLNFRCFEAMGCGAVLITDKISHSLSALGEPGREFLTYEPGSAADLEEKIRWALEHPSEAEAMARRGHELVKSRHLVSHRAAELASTLAATIRRPRNRPDTLGHLAAVHEHVSRLTLPGPLCRYFAGEARRLAREAEARAPRQSWACLVLSRLALEAGRTGQALEHLHNAELPSGDADFRRPYYALMTLLLLHAGKKPEALRSLSQGLAEFPEDADLRKLGGILGL